MPTTPGLGALLPPTQAIGVDGGKWAVRAIAVLPGKNQVSGTIRMAPAPASLSSRAPASAVLSLSTSLEQAKTLGAAPSGRRRRLASRPAVIVPMLKARRRDAPSMRGSQGTKRPRVGA